MIDESTTKPYTIGSSDANRATDETLDILQRSIERLDRKPTALEDPTIKDSTSDSPATKMRVPELSSTKATSTEISGSNLTGIENPAIEILFKFEEDLVEDGKAKMTIVSYVGDVKDFLKWLNNKGVVFGGSISRFYITQYKDHLMENKYAIDTINKKVNSLSSFNHFLIREKYTQDLAVYSKKDKIKVAKGSEAEVEIYTDQEVERILFHLENKKINLRNKLIVHILLYTGLRVGEVVNIKITDIDFLTSHLKVVGKGGKMREVPIKSELLSLIKFYMETERKDHKLNGSEYLLLSQRSESLDRDTINKVLNRIGKELSIKMYPHKFRHTFCSMLISKGVAITTVSKIAGHSNIQTTMDYYVNTSREEKENAINLL